MFGTDNRTHVCLTMQFKNQEMGRLKERVEVGMRMLHKTEWKQKREKRSQEPGVWIDYAAAVADAGSMRAEL